MNTYKVMMTDDSGNTKVRIIAASTENQAMQFSRIGELHFVPQFALQIAKGTPGD